MKKLNNIINKNKTKKLIILSFLIPVIIYTIIFFINGLLTDNTIILGDMRMQYYPLFVYLKGILNGTNSIFYSFSKGLGGTMYGTVFYYLSSPLNIFLIFINKQHIPDFITYLIIIKLSLCGLTMYLYMRKKFNKDNILILSFSILYAFMGYNLNYFLNIMWLDTVILAPLVLIGLERIIEDKSPLLYIITLFISIFCNYYTAYMLCIFCIIYFLYEILLKYNLKNDIEIIKKKIKTFLSSSLLTGIMCCFFIIPSIYEMLNYNRSVGISQVLVHNFNIFDLFSKTYIGSLSLNDNLNYSSLNLYCGIIILPLIYFYFFSNKINKKEKTLTLVFILTMILPCFIGILNYVWHLFTIPSYYSFRYSFLLCLLLIRIGYKSYESIKPQKKEIFLYLMFYLIISMFFIIITWYGNYYEFLNYKLIWVTILILLIYMIVLYKSQKIKDNIISILLILECFLNVFIIFNNSDFMNKKINDYKCDEVAEKYNKRIELSNIYNTSLIYNFKGINSFFSTQNYKNIDFLQKIGLNYSGHNNLYNGIHQSILVDDIIGLEAIIMKEPDNFKNLKMVGKIENTELKEDTIYENEDAFSLGYIIKNECNNLEFEIPYDQKVFNCMFDSNIDFYKTPKIIKETEDKIIYETKKDTMYYIIYNSEEITDNIFGENLDNIVYYTNDFFALKSTGDKLEISLYPELKEKLKVYYFDYNTYNKTIANLDIEQLDYNIEKNKLKGKITTNGGTLMITIPFEKGYIIHIDGKAVNYKKVLDTFIGIDLNEGTHEILIDYKQPGLTLGISITIIGLMGTTLYLRRKKYETKN